MAVIQSGASTSTLTIDPTSKAARVTLYNSKGRSPAATRYGSYIASIYYSSTGAVSIGTTPVMIQNHGFEQSYIRRLVLMLAHQPDSGAVTNTASTVTLGLYKFGGAFYENLTALAISSKKDSTMPNSSTRVWSYGTNAVDLAPTGISIVPDPAITFAVPRSVSGANAVHMLDYNMSVTDNADNDLHMMPGEGWALRFMAASTSVGIGITGFVEWDIYTE